MEKYPILNDICETMLTKNESKRYGVKKAFLPYDFAKSINISSIFAAVKGER